MINHISAAQFIAAKRFGPVERGEVVSRILAVDAVARSQILSVIPGARMTAHFGGYLCNVMVGE